MTEVTELLANQLHVTVYRLDNGWLVRGPGGHWTVHEEAETPEGAALATAHMLYSVLDAVGVPGTAPRACGSGLGAYCVLQM